MQNTRQNNVLHLVLPMLVEFKVSNYRSFRKEQTFSLVASSEKNYLPDNRIVAEFPGMPGLSFLKSAAIYGANASGKSNLLRALVEVAAFVNQSFTGLKPNHQTFAEHFQLSPETIQQPSTFEITFVAQGVRYLFQLVLNRERVISESLTAYPNGLPQRWYRRNWDDAQKKYLWEFKSPSFKRGRQQIHESTRQNTTFISVGAQFDHPQLRPVYDWFASVRVVRVNLPLSPFSTADYALRSPKKHTQVADYVKFADLGIAGCIIDKQSIPLHDLPPEIQASPSIRQSPGHFVAEQMEINFLHHGENDTTVLLKQEQQSDGTIQYFSTLGSWFDVLENGSLLIVDEIDSSLHPILVRKLLQLFQDTKINQNNAQIIFSTHDPLLMDDDLLRRDQIWFTSKNSCGETTLYPLTDFSPRKGEALMKGYLSGRYGALPFLDQEQVKKESI